LRDAGRRDHHPTRDGEERHDQSQRALRQDFFLWTKEQAEGLRHAKASNLPLDWENLARRSKAWESPIDGS